ncbi:MAG: biotin attachment protein [Schwartzia sp.]|nr:biotin attachment protein [Schwartzia sp. (in: firmicutes)]
MRKVALAAGLAFLVFLIWLLGRNPVENATAVIGGEVTWTVRPGDEVTEGSELVRVAALSGGEAVAARARWRGVVRETRVAPGERITSGTVVARIEKK